MENSINGSKRPFDGSLMSGKNLFEIAESLGASVYVRNLSPIAEELKSKWKTEGIPQFSWSVWLKDDWTFVIFVSSDQSLKNKRLALAIWIGNIALNGNEMSESMIVAFSNAESDDERSKKAYRYALELIVSEKDLAFTDMITRNAVILSETFRIPVRAMEARLKYDSSRKR